MKILAIGDPHGYKNIKNIPVDKSIDLILITGDMAESGVVRNAFFKAREQGIEDFRKAMTKKELDELYAKFVNSALEVLEHFDKFGKPVYYVYGNLFGMDYCIMRDCIEDNNLKVPDFETEVKKLKNVVNVGLRKINLRGFAVAGVPYFDNSEWNKEFDPKDRKKKEFARWQEPKVKKFLESVGRVDVLLTHIPPRGCLDKAGDSAPEAWTGKHAGSKGIMNYINRYSPRYVLCGHMHESKGKAKIGGTEVYNLGSSGDYIIIDTEKNKKVQSNFLE